MDNLTHGLLGLAVGALRRPDGGGDTDRAVLLGALVASELPDLDTLWPAPDEVMNALMAHRGLSHSLVAAPVIALVATGVAKAIFRGARMGPVYLYALLSVLLAHLVPDLWTGWGTRVLLPFSADRISWDIAMVVDPFVTLPLLAGAVWAWRRRPVWRRAILTGLAVTVTYVAMRTGLNLHLTNQVAASYPSARQVAVFPAWLGMTEWRYVAVLPGEYAAGTVSTGSGPREERRVAMAAPDLVPADIRRVATVREALAWARFPVVTYEPGPQGGGRVKVGDLRYNLKGEPTLGFVVDVGPDLTVQGARMERGGSAGELLQRWRER